MNPAKGSDGHRSGERNTNLGHLATRRGRDLLDLNGDIVRNRNFQKNRSNESSVSNPMKKLDT